MFEEVTGESSETMDRSHICLVAVACLFVRDVAVGADTSRRFRVVGGFDTNITEVPYQLAMEYGGTPFCSGAIISERFIVTASHCLEKFNPKEVAFRSGSSERSSGGDVIKIKTFTRNPNFNISLLDYDVAVIEANQTITFDEYRTAIELGSEEPQAGEVLTISGWGKTSERGTVSGSLKSATVKVIDRDECRDYYSRKVVITERMFCAGGEGRDSCGGDSGAPATSNGRLIGIVSWGYGCARASYPGVYANLMNPEIREFIRNVSGV